MLLPGIVSLLFLFSCRLVANLEFCFWLGVSNWFSSGASNSVNMLLCFQVPWYVVLCHGLGEKYYCTLVCSFGVLLLNTFICLSDMTLVCVVVTFICVIHQVWTLLIMRLNCFSLHVNFYSYWCYKHVIVYIKGWIANVTWLVSLYASIFMNPIFFPFHIHVFCKLYNIIRFWF
jgi:hypothetical protein